MVNPGGASSSGQRRKRTGKRPKYDKEGGGASGGGKSKKAAAPQKKKAKRDQHNPVSLPSFENFDDGPPPTTIHLITGRALPPPGSRWQEKNSAKEAALGQAFHGRLAGTAHITITTTKEVFDKLITAKPVQERIQTLRGRRRQEAHYDESGEYSLPAGQVPLSRLLSLLDKTGEKIKIPKEDKVMLDHMWALQYPGCSPWQRPLIRLFTHTEPVTPSSSSSSNGSTATTESSTSSSSSSALSWRITFYVYFSRLIFELISDDDVKGLMTHLTPPGRVHPAAKLKEHRAVFTTTSKDSSNDFTLPAVLKKAESTGYTITDPPPEGLRVEMFEYQRSTYQWMLDHERDPHGLNGYFWETWEWADRVDEEDMMYYFPLAGEVRLLKPPRTTGGLLAEEMGMGKTVEMLSVVLGNKRPAEEVGKDIPDPSVKTKAYPPATIKSSRATLVVVPASLLGQWLSEINKVTVKGALSCFSYPGTHQRIVDWSDCRALDGSVLPDDSKERLVLAPWSSEVEEDIMDGSANQRRLYTARVERKLFGGRHVQVSFLLDELGDHDVVLTTYDSLRMHPAMFKKIGWYRCVLDECQEIRTATTQIARMCVGLSSVHRWMMSGTPLATSIDDLNGELGFLSVWPFALSDREDGFWAHRIADPFQKRDPQALELLTQLIKVTMIRHSKAQKYLDGRPLLTIPSRIITWHPVECRHESERYIYSYIEHLASTECEKLAEHLINNEEAAESIITTTRGGSHAKLRALLWALQRSSTHPSLVNLSQLDALKRSLQTFHMLNLQGANGEGAIPKLRVDDVLLRLQGLGASRAGGLNRDVGRNWALGGESLLEARAKYEAQGLVELRRQITEAGLPMPMVWIHLPALGSVAKGSAELRAWPHKDEKGKGPARDGGHHEGEEVDGEDGAAHKPPPSISSVLASQDLIRVGENDDQFEATVMEVGQEGQGVQAHENPRTTQVTLMQPWTTDSQRGAAVYKHAMATRKKAYVDLLLAKDKEEKGMTSELHEAGFASIYRLLEGKAVTCPVCLCSMQEPTITLCGHAFCKPCIISQLESSNQQGQVNTRCAVCRKPVSRGSLMEMDIASIEAFSDETNDKQQVEGNSHKDPMDVEDHDQGEPYEGKGKGRAKPSSRSVKATRSSSRVIPGGGSSSNSSSSSSRAEEASSQGGGASSSSASWDVRLPAVGFPPAADETVLESIPAPFYHQRDARTPSLEPDFLAHYNNCAQIISSKGRAMIEDMKRQLEQDPTSKFVVFSQFSDAVNLLEQQLISQGYTVVSISGHTSKTERAKAVSTFSKDPKCTVFLLTMGAGAVGLTLTAANCVYLLEPTHSLADEAQALNRAHRIGQSRPVKCTIFFVKGTVEERILAARRQEDNFLQNLDDADALTVCRSGAVDTEKGTHFSLDQLQLFFGVRRPSGGTSGGGRS